MKLIYLCFLVLLVSCNLHDQWAIPTRDTGGGLSDVGPIVEEDGLDLSESCDDGVRNQDETGLDCGGKNCDACSDGMGCSGPEDCASSICFMEKCLPRTCGDGIVNGSEECDGDGAGQGGSTPSCDIDCSAAVCGDGLINIEAGEKCDGDGVGSGGQTATCEVDCSEAVCGDGIVNTFAGEGCDDGNQNDFDLCSNACVLAICGDGKVNNGEGCDDANQEDLDSCSNTCVSAVCGDGIVNNGEACDDGNQDDFDLCSNACVLAICGDGKVNNGEGCDDANQDDLDSCSNTCVSAVCGDGIVNNGEDCDDGNQVDDDDCSNTCADTSVLPSCLAWFDAGATADGIYKVNPSGLTVDILCDMTTDGGGWTLVASSNKPLKDKASTSYHSNYTTLVPNVRRNGIWDGMRPITNPNSDIRFTCQSGTNAVDLSFYDIQWYEELTASTNDSAICFEEVGNDTQPAPARRNNITNETRVLNDRWDYDGSLVGEDTCGSSTDFTVDFEDRGMDSNQSDGTDWGEDDGTMKCGQSGLSTGYWQIWVRE